MNITGFNALIVTKQAEENAKLFEELGFQRQHSKRVDENGNDVTTIDMKDSNGFCVEVSQVEVPRDMTVIRMNVDDFETAKAILEKHGFVNTNSGKKVESATSFSEFMVAPSGFAINLVKHVK